MQGDVFKRRCYKILTNSLQFGQRVGNDGHPHSPGSTSFVKDLTTHSQFLSGQHSKCDIFCDMLETVDKSSGVKRAEPTPSFVFEKTEDILDILTDLVGINDKKISGGWTDIPAADAIKPSDYNDPSSQSAHSIAPPSKAKSTAMNQGNKSGNGILTSQDSSDDAHIQAVTVGLIGAEGDVAPSLRRLRQLFKQHDVGDARCVDLRGLKAAVHSMSPSFPNELLVGLFRRCE